MDTELEALVTAFDDFVQARGDEARHLLEVYESRLAVVLEKHPHLSKSALKQAVRFAHVRWTLARQRPPTLTPKA